MGPGDICGQLGEQSEPQHSTRVSVYGRLVINLREIANAGV
jgi:hypothetical protein